MFKIGDIDFKNNVVLAPMAGVSNPAYMKICEEMGVGYQFLEHFCRRRHCEGTGQWCSNATCQV